MKKEMKYEEALHELDSIVEKMERNELDIDQLSANLRKAQELLTFCKAKLKNADEEIQKITFTDEGSHPA
jgi:exodeoxyribonuclease VII small subunit